MNPNLSVISGAVVASTLRDRESEIMDLVAQAYLDHHQGHAIVPHSAFLRPAAPTGARYIALMASTDGGAQADRTIVGLKWIASYPGNVASGHARASALIVLNDSETGTPRTILEGSRISAERTAASAGVAARLLAAPGAEELALIGAGPINAAVARHVAKAIPGLKRVCVVDLNRDRAVGLADDLGTLLGIETTVGSAADESLSRASICSVATNAPTPWIAPETLLVEDGLVLHLSLRDIPASLVLDSDNVVDDLDHVCREATSIALAAQHDSSCGFVRATLGELLSEQTRWRRSKRPVIFSPFGLGMLDLAVADYVAREATINERAVTVVRGFVS